MPLWVFNEMSYWKRLEYNENRRKMEVKVDILKGAMEMFAFHTVWMKKNGLLTVNELPRKTPAIQITA